MTKVYFIPLALAAALVAAPASAQTLSAHLTGAAEKPAAGDADGAGHATIKIDAAKNQVCADLMVEKIAPATMAHIHKAPADAAGPVAVPLTKPDAAGKSSGCATADAAVVKDIAANPAGYYVNVHNAEFPAGAVRGQLSK
jgi:hypothetical protein